ncbi:MAG: hypothetical protein ACR65T_10275 [Methylocystis sp.]
MGSVDLNHVMDEIIPRGDSGAQALTPARQFARGSDDATAALELVS